MRSIVHVLAVSALVALCAVLAVGLSPRVAPSTAGVGVEVALPEAEAAPRTESAPPEQATVPPEPLAVDVSPVEQPPSDDALAVPADEQVSIPVPEPSTDSATLPESTSADGEASDQPAAPIAADTSCDLPLPGPLPPRGDPRFQGFWQAFRLPLPPAPRWNPPGPKRVGLQVGHWRLDQVPRELGRLQGGTSGGGKQEWEVALDLALRTKSLLEQAGFEVDILPATVPARYRAHVFVAIHADGDPAGRVRGFKIARPGFSSIPDVDDRLVASLYTAYESATGLPRDDAHITRRMLYYYAFNSRRYCHAVATGVPQAIIETGFLTSAADRRLLLGNPGLAARGIADGVGAFLNTD
jgi:N-acetylmuramoyl-L-alanine amidase